MYSYNSDKSNTNSKNSKTKNVSKTKSVSKTKNVSKTKSVSKPISKIKSNLINNSTISKINKNKLLSHGLHHTKKHISFMINQLNKGKTFKLSHMSALQKFGK